MGIRLLNGGLNTTVQDLGRNGHQKSGFHVCGAMDQRAMKIANILLDNDENDAVLEFILMGPKIKFTEDTFIAITGGDFTPSLNGQPVPMYQAVPVKKEDELEFKFCIDGNWGYIAFAGGLDVPVEMGSRSTDVKCALGGYEGRKLTVNDEIKFCKKVTYLKNLSGRKCEKPSYADEITEIRVVMGPQEDYFTAKGLETFLNEPYLLTSQSDRMGYRLDGAYIEHNEKGADIISDGIALGSIQVPAHGKPIIMLADRQTTGGYTKIATVASTDISKLVQCKFNKKVSFTKIDIDSAQKLYLDEWQELENMKKTVSRMSKEDWKIGNLLRCLGTFFR